MMSLALGLLFCCAALGAGFFAVFPPRPRITVERMDPAVAEQQTVLARVAAATTKATEGLLRKTERAPALASALEAAGLRMKPAEYLIIVVAFITVVGGLFLAAHQVFLAILVAALVAVGSRLTLGHLAGRRRAAFKDQLDDSLQLMASGLRAGHSLLRAIDALSTESEAPTSEEFARIINETRLGRDVGSALDAAALRMQSEDFQWVSQAIAIHREVGGNLAEVLDQVGQTIRERNAIRRQIASLSAEGRISALVLMLLPVGLGGFIALTSPGYILPLFQSPLGYVMLAVAALLFLIGGLWLRKVISFKF